MWAFCVMILRWVSVGLMILYASRLKSLVLRGCALGARARGVGQLHMHTQAQFVDSDDSGLRQCGESIRSGNLVAFPTETVYGLGANAEDEAAVRSIFTAKARPHTDPLIVHVLGKERMHDLFDFGIGGESGDSRAKEVCEALCDAFWPGPLTLVYKASSKIPSLITANTGFVGLRSPRHYIARELLAICDPIAIAAPSANRFGHVSPTTANHVMDDLGGTADLLILKTIQSESSGSSDCDVGIESTVCSVSPNGDKVTILRCGAVGAQAIQSALSESQLSAEVVVDNQKNNDASSDGASSGSTVAPGQLLKHYAPDVTTYMVSARTLQALKEGHEAAGPLVEMVKGGASILDFAGMFADLKDEGDGRFYRDLSPAGNVEEACKVLFMTLREAEEAQQTLLLPDLKSAYLDGTCRDEQSNDLMQALVERLVRASSGNLI